MLGRLIDRLKCCQSLDVICVATSVDPSDAPLEDFAKAEGIQCYRGSLEDVLGRVLNAGRAMNADLMVEVTGDCPLVDPGIIDAAVTRYRQGGADYLINVLDKLSFPIGFDVQVYRMDLLEEISQLTNDPYDRVNVTPYFYRNGEKYRTINLLAPPELDRPRYRLCVDYPEDFDLVAAVYENLLPAKPDFDAFDIVQFLDAHPELAASNVNRDDSFLFPVSRGGIRHEVLNVRRR